MIEWLLFLMIMLLFVVPISVFLCVKLGVYAFLAGRKAFFNGGFGNGEDEASEGNS